MKEKKEHLENEKSPIPSENETAEAVLAENKKITLDGVLAVGKEVLVGVLLAFCAMLLSSAQTLFGARPFGVALLCASSKKTGYIYAGLALWSLVFLGDVDRVVYLSIYTALVLVRIVGRLLVDNPLKDNKESELSDKIGVSEIYSVLFSEHMLLRMASSCLGAFAIGMFTLVGGGFLYYDLYGAITGMILAPALVFFLLGIFEGQSGGVGMFGGVCALSAMLVVALETSSVQIYGVPLSLVGIMILTLHFCKSRSILHGLIIGTLCGLSYSPMIAPAFAFAAIAAGALWRVSTFFACISSFGVAIAWGLYADGISALTSLMPALLFASLTYAVVDKLFLSEKPIIAVPGKDTETEAVQDGAAVRCRVMGREQLAPIMLDEGRKRADAFKETFSSLSELFWGLSERMRMPSNSDLKHICEGAFDACCTDCEHRDTCWEVEYASTLATLGRVASLLGQRGRIEKKDMPSRLTDRCPSMPEIIDQINKNGALHIKQLVEGDKTEIFALDYESVSRLIEGAVLSEDEKYRVDDELGERFCAELEGLGIGELGVIAYGERKKRILVRAGERAELEKNVSELERIASELCAQNMRAQIYDEADGTSYAVIERAERFSLEIAKRTIPAEGGDGFCGDTVNSFGNRDGVYYTLISDGMGSGRDAAFTSGICSLFLSRILLATDRCDISLRMLNGFLRNKQHGSMHECSATVDLMEFDGSSGEAVFYKGGAAPSYVYRDGNLFKIRSNTVPLGIISELEANRTSLEMGDGDVIVMVSDGVTRSGDECPWLFELLGQTVGHESLDSIADRIVKRAKYEGADDDISVIVARISEVQ